MLLKAEASIRSIVIAAYGDFDDRHFRLMESGDGMAFEPVPNKGGSSGI
jgi:hypothetical protein